MTTYTHTRWWSKWELESKLVQVGNIKAFLQTIQILVKAGTPSNFEDLQTINHWKIELAAGLVDWGVVFIKATYNLQGDSLLALIFLVCMCFPIVYQRHLQQY